MTDRFNEHLKNQTVQEYVNKIKIDLQNLNKDDMSHDEFLLMMRNHLCELYEKGYDNCYSDYF